MGAHCCLQALVSLQIIWVVGNTFIFDQIWGAQPYAFGGSEELRTGAGMQVLHSS